MLNAERALASLEKIGAALPGMAGGNFKFWMLDWKRAARGAAALYGGEQAKRGGRGSRREER